MIRSNRSLTTTASSVKVILSPFLKVCSSLPGSMTTNLEPNRPSVWMAAVLSLGRSTSTPILSVTTAR